MERRGSNVRSQTVVKAGDKEAVPALFRHSSRAHLSSEVSSDIWMFGFDL